MKRNVYFLCSALFCAGVQAAATSNGSTLCTLLEKGTKIVAVPTRSNNEFHAGRLDLGDLSYSSQLEEEGHNISTNFRVAISSRRVVPENRVSNGWYIELTHPQPICKHSQTLQIDLIWNFSRGEKRPYSFEADLPRLVIKKSGHDFDDDVTDAYQFEAKISGRMVEPH